ncbi:dodecin domain-containing protein [Aquimarina sp. AD10]|uniref:Dodecin n=1 Tax=Aquimarina aggregata TaxID=1642818 RepID=A0A162CM35_9FLAO|nr:MULTISPECIES: dodecin family protein [Aquimarina]AXT61169.1 dodecin domain-containing protein [Aquimarina sp. AD10]KZS39264.1 dodecin [Aquimarina aggregata]RKN02215.1 dodecin domain-containing protein [Aquimarina sp. AD10]
MAIVKTIEIIASSEKGWEDATKSGIKQASKTVKNIKSAWVSDQKVMVKDGEVSEYRVNLKVSFEIK